MPRKKKQSTLSKLASALDPTTPLKKLLLFVIVFAVVGGGYYLYQSQAAAQYPTGSLSTGTIPSSTNGYRGIKCLHINLTTGFGPVAYNCMTGVYNDNTGKWSYDIGNYVINAGTFNVAARFSSASSVGLVQKNCGGIIDNINFSGLGYVDTPSGPAAFGYVYLNYGQWFAKTATYSPFSRCNFNRNSQWSPVNYY
jgi:hypothetical protein